MMVNVINQVVLTTDGSCLGNPGPGGWAAILECPQRPERESKVLSGGSGWTTNNIMELTAIIRGLQTLKWSCDVEVRTDAAYVVNTINGGHLERWAHNGWRTAANEPVKNQELWKELYDLTGAHKVRFTKVKGHAGDPRNEKADSTARWQALSHKS